MNGVNELTNEIIKAAIEVHRTLGPGLLESMYVGLLINFNVKHLTMGIRRLVHEPRNNLCDLCVLGGEYLTAIRARRRFGLASAGRGMAKVDG